LYISPKGYPTKPNIQLYTFTVKLNN